jgi:hypothetical protein
MQVGGICPSEKAGGGMQRWPPSRPASDGRKLTLARHGMIWCSRVEVNVAVCCCGEAVSWAAQRPRYSGCGECSHGAFHVQLRKDAAVGLCTNDRSYPGQEAHQPRRRTDAYRGLATGLEEKCDASACGLVVLSVVPGHRMCIQEP